MMRVVFFGMDLRILDALRQCPVDLLGAYLPPAPYLFVQRQHNLLHTIYKIFARRRFKTALVYAALANFLSAHTILPLQGSRVNHPKFITALRQLKPDLGVVANFGQILGADLLSVPTYGMINYHPSLLPKYRGPTPLGHILLNGDVVSGATWHRVTTDVDGGEILEQAAFPITPQDTVKDLELKSAQTAVKILRPLLLAIAGGCLSIKPQDASMATYFPKLTHAEKARLAAMGKLS